MSEIPQPTIEQAVKALIGNPYFVTLCGELMRERELMIGDLAGCETVTQLRKTAADITAIGNLLSRFQIPVVNPPLT